MQSFSIWVTQKCNMACKYCYEKNNIDRDEQIAVCNIEKIVAFIQSKVKKNQDECIAVTFHGGEPLLEFNLIKQYVILIKKSIKSNQVYFSLTTNGVLLNSENAEFIMDNIDDFSISIDGNKESHDLNRVFLNGVGTYDSIIYNIERLHLNKKKIRIRMTVTANNVIRLASGIESLVIAGYKYIAPAVAIEDGDWTPEKFQKLEIELKKIKEKYIHDKNIHIAMIDKRDMRIKTECVGGIKSFNIMSNGDIYPCEYVTGNKEFLLGNVENYHINEEMLRKRYLLDVCSDCESCTYKIYCEGSRCKYVNKLNTGEYQIPSINMCEVENVKYNLYKYLE